MAKKSISVDNINNSTLDKLHVTYKKRKGFKVVDHRLTISSGKPREYFLLRYFGDKNTEIEFTFIWVGPNLWQYKYLNKRCITGANWIDPEILLNQLLNNTFIK